MKISIKFSIIFLLSCSIFASGGCKYVLQSRANINKAPSPVPTPVREYNEKRSPVLRFNSWHRTKPGMILIGDERHEAFYLAAPGQQPEKFSEYKIEQYPASKNPGVSNSGKYEVTVRKFNERVESGGCCAVQHFDYETLLAEVAAPENKTKLSDANWSVQGWSPNDKFLLFSFGSEFFLINAETKEKIDLFSGRSVGRFVFSLDSKGLFATSYDGKEYLLEYFDFASRQLTTMFSGFNGDSEMRLSPDGKKLALFAVNLSSATPPTVENRLHLFDAESKTETHSADLPSGLISSPPQTAWRADGGAIAVGIGGKDYAHDVYSYEIKSGELIKWYPPPGETTALYKQ